MAFKKILAQLNILGQCRRYRLPLWQCPQFLFLIMGIVIIITAIAFYLIGIRYVIEPQMVALVVLIVSAILFIIAFIIIQSLEQLAETSRMKSEFVDIVSHQLRSPLTNLKWTTELLMSGRLGKIREKQAEHFLILKENTGRMGELVDDLLIVSRIERGTFPLRKKEISLENLTKEVISELKIFAEASNVKINFQSQRNLPKVLADPSQIKLVIENLLDNAIRYTKGKGKVEIKLEKREKDLISKKLRFWPVKRRKLLYFGIKDFGVGIPKEDQKYIFQKFFRSENVLRQQTRGSGLGLFIAKSIVKRSGGEIGFQSEENKGSTFWFTLPLISR